jgi:tRNA U38,U39,U40 pseudouridine synthase TruA
MDKITITIDGETFSADQIRRMVARLREPQPRQELPAEYRNELDRVYGACCGEDGDLEARGR